MIWFGEPQDAAPAKPAANNEPNTLVSNLRNRFNLSVEAFGEAIGLARSFVHQIESGARPLPLALVGRLDELCEAYTAEREQDLGAMRAILERMR